MIIVMKINFHRLKGFAVPLLVIALVCLVLVATPLGVEVNGASRWFQIGPVRFAPSELAKLAMVIFLAKSMEANIGKMTSFAKGVAPYIFMLAIACTLIMLQPDLGTAFALAGTVFCMLMVAGAKWSHLGGITLLGMSAVAAAIYFEPYRMGRLMAFTDPWKYASKEGFQTIQSLYALGSGGLFGMGLGRIARILFLPSNIRILFLPSWEKN